MKEGRAMEHWKFDGSGMAVDFPHYWELCVGSCHGTTALREDYRQQLKKAHRDCGFQYVRFHGLFDDDMSILSASGGPTKREKSEENGYILSFTNTDSIVDFLLSIGMKPFFELGFMPQMLTSGKTKLFHYEAHTSPPDDYSMWGWLVEKFVSHCVDRYGLLEVRQWFFEVWNEPNLGGPGAESGFWGGSMEEYFKLYAAAAKAVKKVDSRLRVGGPATACNAWVPELIQFCKTENVPLDFISTHHYPIDVAIQRMREEGLLGKRPGNSLGEEQLMQADNLWNYVPRGVLTEQAREVKEQAMGLPVYYTEWNSNAGIHSDGPFGASYIVKTCMDNVGLVEGYSYWTFSDIFEEGGLPHSPFHGGFGLLNLQGVPKATYRAFQLLHQLGDRMYEQKYTGKTVDLYCVKHTGSHALQIVAVNHAGLKESVQREEVKITVSGIPSFVKATIQRVDGEHGNALACWERCGKPDYSDEELYYQLMAASCIHEEDMETTQSPEGLEIEFPLPEQGIALITLYL